MHINKIGRLFRTHDRLYYLQLFSHKKRGEAWLLANSRLKAELRMIFEDDPQLTSFGCNYGGMTGINMMVRRAGPNSLGLFLQETDAVGSLLGASASGSAITMCDANEVSLEIHHRVQGLQALVLAVCWKAEPTFSFVDCSALPCKVCVCGSIPLRESGAGS
jgi:hypothetical protein